MISTDLVDRYRKVVPLNTQAGNWNLQREHGGNFSYQDWELTTEDLQRALSHEFWLGSRAHPEPWNDRLSFDIDCKDRALRADRNEPYWLLRRRFGIERVPLVYGTPSGLGLRVVYRIPQTPREELISGLHTGLVADVLRGAGLVVKSGVIEIFPQEQQAGRLMLCRRMPLLDPRTLRPLPDANVGDEFDEATFVRALERVEAWHARPCDDLVPHLRTLRRAPDVRLIDHTQPDDGAENVFIRRGDGSIEPKICRDPSG